MDNLIVSIVHVAIGQREFLLTPRDEWRKPQSKKRVPAQAPGQ